MGDGLTTWEGLVTPNGNPLTLTVREGTNDGSLVYATSGGMMGAGADEYRLRGRSWSGWAIDVGAHIGCVAVPLAIDNPRLQVIAIEVLPENCELLRRNVAQNGLADRVHVVEAAAGGPAEVSRTIYWNFRDHPSAGGEYARGSRFIANTLYHDVVEGRVPCDSFRSPVMSLGAILDEFRIDEVAFLKTDAEGAEFAFLDTLDVAYVAEMIGEYHGDYAGQAANAERIAPNTGPTGPLADGQAEIRRLLGATHDVSFLSEHLTTGTFVATRR